MVPLLDPISLNSVTWDKTLRKTSVASDNFLSSKSYYLQQAGVNLISKEIDSHNIATARLLHAGNAIELIHKKASKVTIVKIQSETNDHNTDYSIFHDYAGLSKFSEAKNPSDHALDNKLAYKNKGIWSSRSLSLEQLLKPVLLSKTIPYLELLGQLVTGNNKHICLVDTILVCSNSSESRNFNEINSFYQNEDITDVRYGFNHLSSSWSFAKESFLGKKQWYDKIDINHIVLSLVNDNNHLETTQRKKSHCTNELLKDDLVSSLLKSAKGFESALASKKRISSEGSFPTHAMLMATTVDGILHVRPLCTSGDVVLALHELLDVNIFSSGCIQLPSIVPTNFQRHTEGFYRYTYQLNQNGKWQYLMKKLPFGLLNLHHFIHPSYVDHKVVFDIQDLNEITDVPPCLKDSSIQIAKAVLAFYGKKKLVKTFHLDFEICFDKTKKLSKNSKSNRKINIKTSFFPPHLHKKFCSLNCYIYRFLQITGIEFKECIATYRRDAILDLNPDVKFQNYLRNFELFFKNQWKQVLSETIRTTSTVNNVNNIISNEQSSSSYITVRSREESHASSSNKNSQDGSKLAAFQLAQKLRLNYSLLIDETNPDISDCDVLDEIMAMDEDSDEDSFNAEDNILPIIDGISSLETKDTVFNFARQVISNNNYQQDVSKVNNNLDTNMNVKASKQPSIDYIAKPPISPIKKSNLSSRKKNVKLPTNVIPSFEDSYNSNNINESVDKKILRKFRYDEEKRTEAEKRLHDEYVKAQQKAARMAAHAEAMKVAIKQGTIITNNTIEPIHESQNEHSYSGENEERKNFTPNVHNLSAKRMSTYNSRSSQYARDKRNFKNQAHYIDNDSSNEIYRKLIDKAGDDYLAEIRDKRSITSNDKIIAVDRRNFNARELYLFNNTIDSPSKHISTSENLVTDLMKRVLERDIKEQVQNVDRNDVEYNEKAYRLAEMIDPSYLVGRFNGANHRSGKSIHITNSEDILSFEDENQANEISSVEIISNEFNCYTTNITTLQERRAIAKEKRKTLKREATERKEMLKKGAQDMLEQLLNKLPQHLASKIRTTLEKHELKKKKKLLKQQAKKNRMDFVVKSLNVEDLQDSSSGSETKKKSKRKVLTEKRKSMLNTNPDEVIDLVNVILQTDALSCKSSKSEKNSNNKEMDLTDSDNPSNNSDVEDDVDDEDDINQIANKTIVCTDSSSNIDSTIIDIIDDRRIIADLINSMVLVAETTGDDDDYSNNKDNNNDHKGLLLVQPKLQLKNVSNFTEEDFNSVTNPSVNSKNHVNDEDMVKINARAKRFSLQTTRKFSLMHLAKVMFDGSMTINNVQIDDIATARSLDDISCSIVEESAILDTRDLTNSRLTSPIISVRVSTAPKATALVSHEPVFHYNQKDSFKEIISSLGLNSASPSEYNESFASDYFQSEFIHKMEIRKPKLGSLWEITPSNNMIEYSEHVKVELVADDTNLHNLPEVEESNEKFPTTIEINDLISEVSLNPNMSDSLLSRKTSILNPCHPNLVNNIPAFLKPSKQIMKHKYIKLPRHSSSNNPNVNSKHEELHFKKIKEDVPSNKRLCLIIKNNKSISI